MAWLIVAVLAFAGAIIWWRARGKRQPAGSDAVAALPGPLITGKKLPWPNLPDGLGAALVAEMKALRTPIRIDLPPSLKAVQLTLSGESLSNADGKSRQSIIEATSPGTRVWFVPEPDNEYDQDALCVVVEQPDETLAQMGYFPRGHGLSEAAHSGKIVAWLCSKRRSGDGTWCAVLYAIEVG